MSPYVSDAPGTLINGRYLPDHGGGTDEQGTQHGIPYMPAGFNSSAYRWSRLTVFLPDPKRTARRRPARCGALFIVNHQGYTSTSPVIQWIETGANQLPIVDGNFYRRMAVRALLNNVAVVAVGITGTETDEYEPGGARYGTAPAYGLLAGQRAPGRGTYDKPGETSTGLTHYGVPGAYDHASPTPNEQMARAIQFVRRYQSTFGLYMDGGIDDLGLTCVLGFSAGGKICEDAIYAPDMADSSMLATDPLSHSSRLHSAVILEHPHYYPGFKQDTATNAHAPYFPTAADPTGTRCDEATGLQDAPADYLLAASGHEMAQRGWDGLWAGAPNKAAQQLNASRRPVTLVNLNLVLGSPHETFAAALGSTGRITESMELSGDWTSAARRPVAPYPWLTAHPAISPSLHAQLLRELDIRVGGSGWDDGYHAGASEFWIHEERVTELDAESATTTTDADRVIDPVQPVSALVTNAFDDSAYASMGDGWADWMLARFLEADANWDALVQRTPYYVLTGGDNGEGQAPVAQATLPGPWPRQYFYDHRLQAIWPGGGFAWFEALATTGATKTNLTHPSKPGGALFLETFGPEMSLSYHLRQAEQIDSEQVLLAKFCVPDSAFHDQGVTAWDPTGEENDWDPATTQASGLYLRFFGNTGQDPMEFSLLAATVQFAPPTAPIPWPGLEPLCLFVDVPLNVANSATGLAAKLVALVSGIRAHPDMALQRTIAGFTDPLPVVFGNLPALVPDPPGGFLELDQARAEVRLAAQTLGAAHVVERTAGLKFESGTAYWGAVSQGLYGTDLFRGFAAAISGKYPRARAFAVPSADGRIVST